MTPPLHPVLQAIGPLLARIDATVVDPGQLLPQDVPLAWDGSVIAGIRLPPTSLDGSAAGLPGVDRAGDRSRPGDSAAPAVAGGESAGGLDGIIAEVERHFGAPLVDLNRERKQQAVRMFEEGGAFSYRKSVETVAAALGVSRFTVYNYLNRDRE